LWSLKKSLAAKETKLPLCPGMMIAHHWAANNNHFASFSGWEKPMRHDELTRLVQSTCDASFAVDSDGCITAWNAGAEKLFGLVASETLGQSCGAIVKGTDECGAVCSEHCTVRRSIEQRRPLGNFDLEIETANGRQWSNVSVLVSDDHNSTRPNSIYIVRPIDLRKRLEILVRDFIVSNTSVTPENAVAMIASTRAPAKDIDLSPRELEILRLLARGESSKTGSDQLHISRTTFNNHVQHILKKLGAHNRLEAIRRAEHAGLI
jgi:PAS domain S-box-containing protein